MSDLPFRDGTRRGAESPGPSGFVPTANVCLVAAVPPLSLLSSRDAMMLSAEPNWNRSLTLAVATRPPLLKLPSRRNIATLEGDLPRMSSALSEHRPCVDQQILAKNLRRGRFLKTLGRFSRAASQSLHESYMKARSACIFSPCPAAHLTPASSLSCVSYFLHIDSTQRHPFVPHPRTAAERAASPGTRPRQVFCHGFL